MTQIFKPAPVDEKLMAAVLQEYNLDPKKQIPMLPHGRDAVVGKETRQLYFGFALTEDSTVLNPKPILRGDSSLAASQVLLPTTRIVSFGDCNVACPYCKRDCQFIDSAGNVIAAVNIHVSQLFGLAEGAVARGEMVRYSGGDPVLFPRETLAVAEYLWKRHNKKVSIAHNGSGTAWVARLSPYLSSAAIDLKAVPPKMGHIMGVKGSLGERLYQKSLQTQRVVTDAGALLDVRTPVFGDTTETEMMSLAADIAKNDIARTFWTWRMYKKVEGCDWTVPEKESIFAMMERVSAAYPALWMGVRAKWQRGGMVYLREGAIINHVEAAKITDIEASGSGNFVVINPEGEKGSITQS